MCVVIGPIQTAAVPFHFWCPDVFEGAAAEVGAFLSVASKAAALALTARFLFTFGGLTGSGRGELIASALSLAWAVFAAVTTTFGNLAALAQTNMKRLLAYSTIAHAGVMMMALVPIGPRAVGPLLFYICAYLLMNLGAFAVVALVRNQTGSESIDAYRGLIQRSPVLAVAMAFFLLSLLGIPPLAGFAAKFQVFAVLYDTGRSFGADELFGWVYFGLLIVLALNTALSAGYYLRVIRAMTLDDPQDAEPIRVPWGGRALVVLLAALVLAVGVFWDPLMRRRAWIAGLHNVGRNVTEGRRRSKRRTETLTEVYCRERLSFLQYVRQASPYAGPADKPLLERVRESRGGVSRPTDLPIPDRNHISPCMSGRFEPLYKLQLCRPKLLPWLVEDETRGLASLERDAAVLPPGESRSWVEKLAESKRMHLTELVKFAQ